MGATDQPRYNSFGVIRDCVIMALQCMYMYVYMCVYVSVYMCMPVAYMHLFCMGTLRYMGMYV